MTVTTIAATGNTAEYGGGLENDYQATIGTTTFQQNTASTGGGASTTTPPPRWPCGSAR